MPDLQIDQQGYERHDPDYRRDVEPEAILQILDCRILAHFADRQADDDDQRRMYETHQKLHGDPS
jgi:hypothetical protein